MKVMLAGGLAGAFSKTCTAPLGRMTILFQLGAFKGQESVWGAIKQVVHSQVYLCGIKNRQPRASGPLNSYLMCRVSIGLCLNALEAVL